MQSSARKQKISQSFLDKFKGKTSKVGKEGINNLLDKQSILETLNHNNHPIQRPIRPRFKPHSSNQSDDYELKKVDLDQIIPSNPINRKSQQSISKRITYNNKIMSNKIEYVPTVYNPLKQGTKNPNPPSRAISQTEKLVNNNDSNKYIFGKYLKLDHDAMKHLQFLQEIQKKINIDRSSHSKITTR